MHNMYINLTLDLRKFAYGQYDLRVPVGISMKELLHIVAQAYQLELKVVSPSIRVHEKGVVLTALQRIEDVGTLRDGVQFIVETL